MLMNLHKKGWTEGLRLEQFDELRHKNEGAVKVRRPPGLLLHRATG
jgi:hypothetical protein